MRTPVRTYLFKNHENVWRIHQKALSLQVMSQKTFQTRYISCVLLVLTCLLTACSGGGGNSEELDPPAPNPTPNPTSENQEIKLNANVWNMMEGMRATFYDAGTITSGSFTASAYVENTTTAYISPVTVNWVTDKWEFSDGKHYWPATEKLDFFAYMPKEESKPSYITSVTYAVNGTPAPAPYFTCTNLPIAFTTADATQEFIWALTTGQNKTEQGATGVTMTFKHPFARIKFKLSAASGEHVKVNSITISNVYRDGVCTIDNTGASIWSALSNNTGNLVISGDPATDDDAAYLVIPNNYGSQTLTVNATWDDWSVVTKDVTASVTFNWVAGSSYTYTLTLSKYALKVDTNQFTEQW